MKQSRGARQAPLGKLAECCFPRYRLLFDHRNADKNLKKKNKRREVVKSAFIFAFFKMKSDAATDIQHLSLPKIIRLRSELCVKTRTIRSLKIPHEATFRTCTLNDGQLHLLLYPDPTE